MKKENNIKKRGFIIIFLIALLIAITNYLIYPIFIRKRMNLIEVPISKMEILEGELINDGMISTILIDGNSLPNNVETDIDNIIGKYVVSDYKISINGFFYKDAIKDTQYLYGPIFSDLAENEYAYVLNVDEKWLANELFCKNEYIDIMYCQQYRNEKGINSYMFGSLASHVRIIDIQKVNETNKLILALSEEDLSIFTICSKLAIKNEGEIIPILGYNSLSKYNDFVYLDKDSLREYLIQTAEVFSKR